MHIDCQFRHVTWRRQHRWPTESKPKPLRLDTVTLHKTAMFTATAAMAAEIVLGFLTASREGSIAQRDLALAHQIIGYTALVATATQPAR